MNKLLKLVLFLGLMAFGLFGPSVAYAVQEPSFPLCSNPQGSLKVSYDGGVHGVIGDETTYQGRDWVYSLDDSNLMQCLCTDDGRGIQTNWWKVSSLDSEAVSALIGQGWYYVVDGTAWGLEEAPYLAKNSTYSCGGGSNGFQYGGPPVCDAERPDRPLLLSVVRKGNEAYLTWTKVDNATHYTISYGPEAGNHPYGVPNTGNVDSFTIGELNPNQDYDFVVYAVNDCMPSEPSTKATVGGRVLGLATTGGNYLLYTVAVVGALLTTSGVYLRKKAKNS